MGRIFCSLNIRDHEQTARGLFLPPEDMNSFGSIVFDYEHIIGANLHCERKNWAVLKVIKECLKGLETVRPPAKQWTIEMDISSYFFVLVIVHRYGNLGCNGVVFRVYSCFPNNNFEFHSYSLLTKIFAKDKKDLLWVL